MLLFENNKVNNEADSYVLGFLYADGYLGNKYNGQNRSVNISLSNKDYNFLLMLGQIMDAKVRGGIKQGKYTICKLFKYDLKLVKALEHFGFTNNKTYDQIDIIKYVPKKLIHHFLRGFFDGDGSIYLAKNNYNTHIIGFVGLNKILFSQLQHIFSSVLGRDVKYFLEKDKYCRIRIKGNASLIKIREYLYKDSTIYLDRKKQIFDKLNIYNGKNGTVGLAYDKKRNKWIAKVHGQYLGIFIEKSDAVARIEQFMGSKIILSER